MNELASLGIILLFALLAGHLAKFAHIPEVTGYILAGVAVGPHVLGWITHENLSTLQVFSEVALGLILFSIGSVFEFSRFQILGKSAVVITAAESLLAGFLVTWGMRLAGQPWQVCLLLGAIAMETAAASTLMVIRECNAKGKLTDILTGVIAVNNIFCLLGYSIVAAILDLHVRLQDRGHVWAGLGQALFPLGWQMIGSVALGFLIGLVLALWAAQVHEQGETLILLAGSVLLCVGLSEVLELSPLVASLAVGATMVNLSTKGRKLFDSLSKTDPPLYAIFFVIAGADLNLSLLPTIGVLGFVYVAGRALGKFAGTRFAAGGMHLAPRIQQLLGLSMLAQAGLAIGLVLVTNQRFPAFAPTVSTVVLASVAIFELIGPISARFALVKSGETRAADHDVDSALTSAL